MPTRRLSRNFEIDTEHGIYSVLFIEDGKHVLSRSGEEGMLRRWRVDDRHEVTNRLEWKRQRSLLLRCPQIGDGWSVDRGLRRGGIEMSVWGSGILCRYFSRFGPIRDGRG